MRYLISFFHFFYFLFASRRLKPDSSFITYTIPEGGHYCDRSVLRPVVLRSLKLLFSFNETALYISQDPANQYDVNKLMGFTVGGWNAHRNSLRIGWSYDDGFFRLYAYVYLNGVRSVEPLLTVKLGQLIEANITVFEEHYYFFAKIVGEEDNKARGEVLILRPARGKVDVKGVMLWPFFGGDEVSPHAIQIQIQRI